MEDILIDAEEGEQNWELKSSNGPIISNQYLKSED